MARPRKLSGVLLTDQVPMWTEAGVDPQPYPLAMLVRFSVLLDDLFTAGADLNGIKKMSDACRDWYGFCLPAGGTPPKDLDHWERLAREFAAADAGHTAQG